METIKNSVDICLKIIGEQSLSELTANLEKHCETINREDNLKKCYEHFAFIAAYSMKIMKEIK